MTGQGDEDYLTTAQVARRLRVKPETVYAYVSRGLLTSVRARGQRGSLFAAADVERVASRSVDHSGAVEETESALTLQTGDELYYRGRSVPDLATTRTLESVAHLLWTGELTDQPPFPVHDPSVDLARAAIAVLPPTARRTDQLRVAVAALGAADPLRFDLQPTSITAAARTLLGTLITALPGP
ncbi:helix-turn-helix domain-containing protein, partial [Kribbella antibiotica]